MRAIVQPHQENVIDGMFGFTYNGEGVVYLRQSNRKENEQHLSHRIEFPPERDWFILPEESRGKQWLMTYSSKAGR